MGIILSFHPTSPYFPSHRAQGLVARGKGGVTQNRGGGLPGDPPWKFFILAGVGAQTRALLKPEEPVHDRVALFSK